MAVGSARRVAFAVSADSLRLNEFVSNRPTDQHCDVACAGLSCNVTPMEFHCLRRHYELGRDLLACQPIAGEFKDVQFCRLELRIAGVRLVRGVRYVIHLLPHAASILSPHRLHARSQKESILAARLASAAVLVAP